MSHRDRLRLSFIPIPRPSAVADLFRSHERGICCQAARMFNTSSTINTYPIVRIRVIMDQRNLGSNKRSWTGPVERDVLARIRRPLKLEAERVDGTDDRFAPGHELSRPGLGARRVHQLRIFSRQTCRAGQSLGPGLHFAGDLGSPLGAVRRDLERDPRALYAANLPAFGE